MRQSLSLRVSQHLALTPQLQQSIRLLQLSTLELNQEVDQMLDDNPFLERTTEEAERESFGLPTADAPVSRGEREAEIAPELEAADADLTRAAAVNDDLEAWGEQGPTDWEGDGSLSLSPDDSEWGAEAAARGRGGDDDEALSAADLARSHETLQAHLHRQAGLLFLGAEDRAALDYLIESLNDDGYLEDDPADLAAALAGGDAEALQALQHHFAVAERLLHNLEPAGVGARTLAQCLSLQLQALQATAPGPISPDAATVAVALRLLQQPLDWLARRDVRRLCAHAAATEAQVRDAMALIARLDPKPGRRFLDLERMVVVPDVLVSAVGHGPSARFVVRLNPEVMPRLRVHDVYANALRGQRGDGAGALQQRLQEARWFIKNIQQRFDTILRVSQAIVERQKSFFIHGELAMRPLVLREIADELGLHESTISRVTTAKYMATPLGTFELKYFFGSGLGTESGGNASSTAVRALIKQFVAAENPNKPLSDNQISDMLKEQGIECARRTVAKYRESLRIAPASLRKAL